MGEVYVKDIISDINSVLNSYQGKTIVSTYDNTDQLTARSNTTVAIPAGLPTGDEVNAKEGLDELRRSAERLEVEFEKAKKKAAAKLGNNPEHRRKVLFTRKQDSKNTATRRRKPTEREKRAFEKFIGNQPSFKGTLFDNSKRGALSEERDTASRTALIASGIKTKKSKRRKNEKSKKRKRNKKRKTVKKR